MRTKFTGLQAVLLAFVFPLIIVFAAIVTGTSMQWEETTSGLTGLLLLVPYYCILYFLRDKLKKRFIFTLKNLIDKHIMILIAVISLGAIGAIGAVFLYAASKKFEVYEDPRIAQVQEVLPGANCGGCGYPGCGGFATACVKADTLDGLLCP